MLYFDKFPIFDNLTKKVKKLLTTLFHYAIIKTRKEEKGMKKRYTIDNYLVFCKAYNLKQTDYNNLLRFKRFCKNTSDNLFSATLKVC